MSSSLEQLKEIWRTCDCVCFDVDSTVCKNEAIDDLAQFAGKGKDVEKLTLEAMSGNMSFREALSRRLSIIRPSKQLIEKFNKLQASQMTPGIDKLVNYLHYTRNIPVYLISGGFRLIIDPVADCLGISRDNVFANRILFDENGEYTGFDEAEMTSESGGKGRAIEFLKTKYGYKSVVMIGDGATDLESAPPAAGFIGFGANVVREKVKAGASWFVYDFQELLDELAISKETKESSSANRVPNGIEYT